MLFGHVGAKEYKRSYHTIHTTAGTARIVVLFLSSSAGQGGASKSTYQSKPNKKQWHASMERDCVSVWACMDTLHRGGRAVHFLWPCLPALCQQLVRSPDLPSGLLPSLSVHATGPELIWTIAAAPASAACGMPTPEEELLWSQLSWGMVVPGWLA